VTAKRSSAARCARATFGLLLIAGVLAAQSLPTATLAGRVTSEEGAGLSGITVRLESKSLQGFRETSTSETGDFLAALLPAGEYTVTFRAGAMQTVARTVDLPAAATVRLDQRMQPAAVAESIEVSASEFTARLTTPAVEANYDKRLVDRLPIDRSLRSVALLARASTRTGLKGTSAPSTTGRL
jgi:hypothetical protein